MMKSVLKLTILHLFLWGITSCDSNNSEPEEAITTPTQLQEELNKNLSTWQGAAIERYQFTYRRSCFCPPEPDAIVITLQDGQIVDASYRTIDLAFSPDLLPTLPSLEELFQEIQKRLDEGYTQIDVKYDTSLGFPEDLYTDVNEFIVDEEIGHSISEFTVLD